MKLLILVCTALLAIGTTVILGALAFTPLAGLWFGVVAGLPDSLAAIAVDNVWMALPIPAMRALQSWYQGRLVNTRQTRAITEAVAVFAVVCCSVLFYGVHRANWPGLSVMIVSYSLGRVMQTLWLALRARQTY